MWLPQAILTTAAVYTIAGILFGGWFVILGVAKLDSAAHSAPIGFRILILPGCIALWPLMLVKLIVAARRHG